MQRPLEPDIAGERVKPGVGRQTRSAAIRPLHPGDSRGVPRSEQLEVRGRDNGEGLVVNITLQEHRPIPSQPDPELATFPPEALVSGSVWLIWAFADPRPATQ